MGAADRGDQLRSQEGLEHRVRKGPWRALAWEFFLELALCNSFLRQKHGQPNWKPLRTLHKWREQISRDILREYGHKASLRQRGCAGNTTTPILQHKRVTRHKSSPCKGCQGVQRRQPLQPRSHNKRPTQARSGCETCDLAICSRQACWDFYHKIN
jgi:hypothetical protein